MKSKNTYSLPFKKETKFSAISDPRAHYGNFKHAIDFLINPNEPILAPLDGVIWNVKDDSKEGGDNEKFAEWKYQNLITIKHKNNEFSQFVHLAHKSATVKIGDNVKKGDMIAKGVDIIGFTTALHLHMMVFKIIGENNKFESLEIQFNEKIEVKR